MLCKKRVNFVVGGPLKLTPRPLSPMAYLARILVCVCVGGGGGGGGGRPGGGL